MSGSLAVQKRGFATSLKYEAGNYGTGGNQIRSWFLDRDFRSCRSRYVMPLLGLVG